jgi:hypothetical protein
MRGLSRRARFTICDFARGNIHHELGKARGGAFGVG